MTKGVRSAVVVGAVVGAALLGGCSTSPGAAAVVDGRTITQAELSRTMDEVGPLLQGADNRTILTALMAAPYFIEAAAQNDVAVSATQTRSAMDEAADAAGLEPTDWGESSVQLVQFTFAAQNLQALPDGPEAIAEVESEIFEAETTVNPRYGVLDEETRQLVEPELPWIVQPDQ